MKTKLLFVAFFALLFTGCKDEKKEQEAPAPKEPQFSVTFEMTVLTDDDFALLYTEDGSTQFGENVIWAQVKGNPAPQMITYTVPEGRYPTQLRLDLGLKEPKDVIFHAVSFDYAGKSKKITGEDLKFYFRADTSKCVYDPVTGAITPVEKDGKKLNGSLYPMEATLGPELMNLAK